MTDRVPPHNNDAEQAVLGSMLLDKRASEGALSLLTTDDFYRPTHASIFRAMVDLDAAGDAIDHLSVAAKTKNQQAKAYLLDLSSSVPTSANWRRYAEIVKRCARLRNIIGASTDAIAKAYDDSDPDTVSSELMAHVEGTAPESGRISTMEQIRDETDLTKRVETFTTEILPHVYMQRGDFVMIGARPSVGKTAMALQVGEELASRHVRTRMYSHEMSREQVYRRSIQRHTGIDFPTQMKGLDAGHSQMVSEAMTGDWMRFLQVGDSNPTLRQVCAEIRNFARQGGSIVIIDHLHILVDGSDRQAVTQATRALKLAANDATLNPTGGPDRRPIVLCLAQFTRLEKRDDGTFRPPTIQSFKESGSSEADVDIAVLLHKYDSAKDEKAREAFESSNYLLEFDSQKGTGSVVKDLCHIEVAKNRYHKTAMYPAWFDGEEQRWSIVDQQRRHAASACSSTGVDAR